MAGIPGQILEELDEIGKQIGTEATKVPKDITGKALESLGMSTSQKGTSQTTQTKMGVGEASKQDSPLTQLDQTKDLSVKRKMARTALSYIAGVKPKPKEPTVREKLEKEEKEKETFAKQQVAAAARDEVPKTGSAHPRGDLYGIKAKQQATEMRANIRQD